MRIITEEKARKILAKIESAGLNLAEVAAVIEGLNLNDTKEQNEHNRN